MTNLEESFLVAGEYSGREDEREDCIRELVRGEFDAVIDRVDDFGDSSGRLYEESQDAGHRGVMMAESPEMQSNLLQFIRAVRNTNSE